MSPDRERLNHIRQILGHLEGSPSATLTEAVKIQIAHAWRIIEAAEPDSEGAWSVVVRDPKDDRRYSVGVGYHGGQGFDRDRAAATLRYALHRAALRALAQFDEQALFDALHEVRPRLEIVSLARTNPSEEDTWHVVLDPGAILRRPRLPITDTVAAAGPEDAEALARWNASLPRRSGPFTAASADEHVTTMYETWRLVDVRKVLPTIYELGETVSGLGLAIPDSPDGRRLKRWIAAIAEQRPTESDFVPDDLTRLR